MNNQSIEGNYRLHNKIGEGTYGTVYMAVDLRTDKRYAIKKVKIRKMDEGLPKEFLREIESRECLKKVDRESHVIDIQEVYLGKTTLNIVYSPYCPLGDLHVFLNGVSDSQRTLNLS